MSYKKRVIKRERPQRPTSNVFAMFDQNQIQEFKEAFYMIDQDKDGFITRDDLLDIFASLGKSQILKIQF
jgi:myosin regulatory light chain 12